MQDVRSKYDIGAISRQKSIECMPNDQSHYMLHYRKKYRKTKNANYTHSINSLQTKRSTQNVVKRHKVISHRKGLSINAIDAFNINTQRQAIIQEFPKKYSQMKPVQFNFRNRSQRLNTVSQKVLDYKEKKLQDCIELMKGVLQQIKNQKSCRRLVKPVAGEQCKEKVAKQKVTIAVKQQSKSKFEKYINSITKLKSDSKMLIIKKNRSKSRSTINNENMFSNRLTKGDRLDALKKQRQDENKQQSLISFNISNSQVMKQEEKDKRQQQKQSMRLDESVSLSMKKGHQMQSIQCSSIAKINESSFISQHGKKILANNILEENLNTINKQKCEQKKGKIKNSKILKHIFPYDFF